MAHQQERFESFLKREISEFLQQNAPRKESAFISVARVASEERSDKAEVFVSVFPENQTKEVFRQIKRMEKATRKYVSSKSRRQFIPEIIFKEASNQNSAARLEKLLEKVKNE